MGFVKDTADSITGKGGAKAAKEAGKIGKQAADDGIDLTSRMYDTNVQRMQPYADAGPKGLYGMGLVANAPDNSYNELKGNTASGYGQYTQGMNQTLNDGQSNANKWLMGMMDTANKPYSELHGFQDASNTMQRQVMSNNAASGKLGSGNTLMDLFRENAALGESMRTNQLGNEMSLANYHGNANQQKFNNQMQTGTFNENAFNNDYTRRLNTEQYGQNARSNAFNRFGSLADMGFNATNNQAIFGSNAVSNINNLAMGGANAQAAGIIGAQNARNQGVGNMIQLASMAAGAYGGGAPGAAATSGTAPPGGFGSTQNYLNYMGI